jgi:hypothetical protein
MKKMIIATVALAVLTAPAFAGGRGGGYGHSGHNGRGNDQALGVKVGVNTGKGGLIGSLLGNNSRHGSTGLGVKVGLKTGRGGVLGALLGGGRGSSHGYGHGW